MRYPDEDIFSAKTMIMTSLKTKGAKTELTHPRSGRKMMIDKEIYDVVSKAIYHELKKNKSMSWTDLSAGVADCLAAQKTKIDGSVEWYAISIRNDMVTKGIVKIFKDKGRMMNALAD